MMTDQPRLDRRLALEASFDGSIPRDRLGAPRPLPRPADAWRLLRQIAERRRGLSAAAAQTDPALARLGQHLRWLVLDDRGAG